MWCLITLCVGPIFAGLLPTLFGWTDPAAGSGWNVKALYLFAGYSPRVVVESLMRFGDSVFRPATKGLEQESRIALSRIQGIGADEAERLAEEGITEVHGLASVDPLRLMRDTRFDNWRILSWVDQALLVSVLPKELCEKLQKQGLWGATDLFSTTDDGPKGIDDSEQRIVSCLKGDARVTELRLLVQLVRFGTIEPMPPHTPSLAREIGAPDSG